MNNRSLLKALVTLACFITINANAQKFEGRALAPPMGWNSWRKFPCEVHEKIIRKAADEMAAGGMKAEC